MALELKKSSAWWYGRCRIKGRLWRFKLGVRVAGHRPRSVAQEGDGAFERSRGQAQREHDRILEDIRSRQSVEELTQRMVEAKTGQSPRRTELASLAEAWERLPRQRVPSAGHLAYGRAVLKRFVGFLNKSYRDVDELAAVSSEQVRAFMQAEEQRGITSRTWNGTRTLLRQVFRSLEPYADGYRGYLSTLPPKSNRTIHREPFNPEELQAVLAAAQEDDLLRALIVTAVCTAMRRGDCARLKWADVDLRAGYITVKSGKTGERLEVPILPLLRAELDRRPKTGEFVFPEAAELYGKDPGALNRRLGQVLKRAGFVAPTQAARAREEAPSRPALPTITPEETERRGLEFIAGLHISAPKRARMKAILTAYVGGKSLKQVSRELGVSPGTVSQHLNAVQRGLGTAVIRPAPVPEMPARVRGMTQTDIRSSPRLKQASLKGWHSFRTTFITGALSAGMPIELVRRVTGHTTVDVVLRHYFRPGREQFRQALHAAMPRLLTEEGKSPREEVRQIVEKMTTKTLGRDKTRLLELIARI